MRKPTNDVDMMLSSAAYFIAKHYGLSLPEVWKMNMRKFQESLVWASAAERVKAEEMEKASGESKSKTRVASTHGTMPFSN